MGYKSISDETHDTIERVEFNESVKQQIGYLDIPTQWEQFYNQASSSPQIHFVKTHHPPRDKQPAIYIVRDGRAALVSYAKFHRQFHKESKKTLLDLVLGNDYYGGWSDHYQSWNSRDGGPTLVVRYEELVDLPDPLLAHLCEFIGMDIPTSSWQNPFRLMHIENPDFFSHGQKEWKGAEEWTPFIDAVFFKIHGALMRQLDYVRSDQVELTHEPLTINESILVATTIGLAAERRKLQEVCDERLSVINILDAEVRRLLS